MICLKYCPNIGHTLICNLERSYSPHPSTIACITALSFCRILNPFHSQSSTLSTKYHVQSQHQAASLWASTCPANLNNNTRLTPQLQNMSLPLCPASITAAPLSTHSKLSIFDGLIECGNAALPPVFILAGSSLDYLACQTSKIIENWFSLGIENSSGRNLHWVGAVEMPVILASHTTAVPTNNGMQAMVRRGEGRDDAGEEGNKRIGKLIRLN